MDAVPFIKMHGLGNDFVVIDARAQAFIPSVAVVRALADRRTGVGCDTLVIIEPPRNGLADAFMRIRNADGSEVAACGNATRCVAALMMREKGSTQVVIETAAGLLDAEAAAHGLISVDLGRISFDWRDIPLSQATNTEHLGIEAGPLRDPVAVSVGNPHAVFFVDDADAVALDVFGPQVERHPLFPERTNVEAVQVLARDRLRMRVWERGVGITQACGTGACATVAAAVLRGLAERSATVLLDGGELRVDWLRDDHVLMTGPVATAFTGVLDPSLAG